MPALQTARAIQGYRSVLEDRTEWIDAGEAFVLVVADGAGGRAGGAAAAEAVVAHVRAVVVSMPPWQLPDPHAWVGLLSEIDERLVDDPDAGETTAVVAAITAAGIAGASVGDSGAWIVTRDGYDDLTAGQRAKPFLGNGMALPMPFSARRWEGTLLVASDGLFKYADGDSICAVARGEDLAAAAERLVDLVRLPSGSLPDDVAVLLARRRE
jgi:PPM family protein phosphatase